MIGHGCPPASGYGCPLLPAKEYTMIKVVKSENKFGLPFMVPDLVFSKDLLKGNLKLMIGNQMQDVQT